MDHFYSHGKLLLSGEYAILDGAKGLAVPTTYGQSLTTANTTGNTLEWSSFDNSGQTWFAATLDTNFNTMDSTDSAIAQRLSQILKEAADLSPSFVAKALGKKVTTHLEFPRNWGLGTSSTLINNIAQWANVNAYELLEKTFGGSGYDLACAQRTAPLTFRLAGSALSPVVEAVPFNPGFKENIFFVYLNQKQNSREGIANYRQKVPKGNVPKLVTAIDQLTDRMISAQELGEFMAILQEHESLLSGVLNTPAIADRLFPDFDGAVKSLGAWGGDFVMAASPTDVQSYFRGKGYNTIITYAEMVKYN